MQTNRIDEKITIEVKITIHLYIERLIKCIITGVTDPHFTVFNY